MKARCAVALLSLFIGFAPTAPIVPAVARDLGADGMRAPLVRDVVVVVENTAALDLNRIAGRPQPLSNLKAGLAGLAAAVTVASSARVGLVRFGCEPVLDVPLGSGRVHVERWLHRFDALAGDQGGGSEVHLAINRALAEMLPPIDAAPPDSVDARGVMVIVDAGGYWCQDEFPRPGGGMYPEAESSCAAVHDAGITVAVVALRGSQGRMESCSTPGWFYRSTDEDGTGLPAIFEALRDRLMPVVNARSYLPILTRAR